ncbi:MAG TPA: nodulation protein NfeD, partial [Actinomycetota bacterium]|nr:nodulation protein NfeD [Actinomycetota bacterium]
MSFVRPLLRSLPRATLLVLLGALVGSLVSPAAVAQEDDSRTLDVIRVEGIIDPPTADYLRSSLEGAEEDGVHVAVIQLDTPGGLDVSMRAIIQQILDSEVPVVVWIAPRGARAASAGTYITYAANLAYMAEATELGAATPIDLGGGDLDRKVTEDAAAYIRSLALARDRNVEWAEEAVREGASLAAPEAAEMNVVDGVASSLGDLVRALDGAVVTTAGGARITLETWDETADPPTPSVRIRFQEMNVMQRLLHAVTTPDIAYLLLLVGFFGIIFELYNPG